MKNETRLKLDPYFKRFSHLHFRQEGISNECQFNGESTAPYEEMKMRDIRYLFQLEFGFSYSRIIPSHFAAARLLSFSISHIVGSALLMHDLVLLVALCVFCAKNP